MVSGVIRAMYLKRLQMRHYIAVFWQHIMSIIVVFFAMAAMLYALLVVIHATQRVKLAEQMAEQAKAEREAVLQVLAGNMVMVEEGQNPKLATVVWQSAVAQKELLK